MKRTIIALLSIISLSATAQDSSAKRDTVRVPVYVYDKIDTIKVPSLLYKGPNKTVMYSEPGYVIYKTPVTNGKNGKPEPVGQGMPIGALDDKKKPVRPLF